MIDTDFPCSTVKTDLIILLIWVNEGKEVVHHGLTSKPYPQDKSLLARLSMILENDSVDGAYILR